MTLADIQTLIFFLFVHQDFLKYTSKAGLDCEEIEVCFVSLLSFSVNHLISFQKHQATEPQLCSCFLLLISLSLII